MHRYEPNEYRRRQRISQYFYYNTQNYQLQDSSSNQYQSSNYQQQTCDTIVMCEPTFNLQNLILSEENIILRKKNNIVKRYKSIRDQVKIANRDFGQIMKEMNLDQRKNQLQNKRSQLQLWLKKIAQIDQEVKKISGKFDLTLFDIMASKNDLMVQVTNFQVFLKEQEAHIREQKSIQLNKDAEVQEFLKRKEGNQEERQLINFNQFLFSKEFQERIQGLKKRKMEQHWKQKYKKAFQEIFKE